MLMFSMYSQNNYDEIISYIITKDFHQIDGNDFLEVAVESGTAPRESFVPQQIKFQFQFSKFSASFYVV